MIKITESNYEYYKGIFTIFSKHMLGMVRIEVVKKMNPDDYPIGVLNRWEKKSKSLARKGLQEGISDVLANTHEYPIEIRTAFDADLQKAGYPTLEELKAIK